MNIINNLSGLARTFQQDQKSLFKHFPSKIQQIPRFYYSGLSTLWTVKWTEQCNSTLCLIHSFCLYLKLHHWLNSEQTTYKHAKNFFSNAINWSIEGSQIIQILSLTLTSPLLKTLDPFWFCFSHLCNNQVKWRYLLSLRCLEQLSYSSKGIRTGQLWHSRYWVSSNLRGLRRNLCWRRWWTWEFQRNWERATLLQSIYFILWSTCTSSKQVSTCYII